MQDSQVLVRHNVKAHVLAKTYDNYTGFFPELKKEFSDIVVKKKIYDIGFTTIRNQSQQTLSCGGERIDGGMSVLFAQTGNGSLIKLTIDTAYGRKLPLLERGVRYCKYDAFQETIDINEVYFYDAANKSVNDSNDDTIVTVTEATEDELQEIFKTFDGYMKENHFEYNFQLDNCPEFSKYSEDPEKYKGGDEIPPPTILMVKVDRTAIKTFNQC